MVEGVALVLQLKLHRKQFKIHTGVREGGGVIPLMHGWNGAAIHPNFYSIVFMFMEIAATQRIEM